MSHRNPYKLCQEDTKHGLSLDFWHACTLLLDWASYNAAKCCKQLTLRYRKPPEHASTCKSTTA